MKTTAVSVPGERGLGSRSSQCRWIGLCRSRTIRPGTALLPPSSGAGASVGHGGREPGEFRRRGRGARKRLPPVSACSGCRAEAPCPASDAGNRTASPGPGSARPAHAGTSDRPQPRLPEGPCQSRSSCPGTAAFAGGGEPFSPGASWRSRLRLRAFRPRPFRWRARPVAEALAAARKAMAIVPGSGESLLAAAEAAFLTGDHGTAKSCFQRIPATDAKSDALKGLMLYLHYDPRGVARNSIAPIAAGPACRPRARAGYRRTIRRRTGGSGSDISRLISSIIRWAAT